MCVHALGYSVLICEMVQVVRELDKEDLALLIQFVTGTSKVPLDGFKALQVRSHRPLPHPRCVLMYTAKPCIREGLSACYFVYVTEKSGQGEHVADHAKCNLLNSLCSSIKHAVLELSC